MIVLIFDLRKLQLTRRQMLQVCGKACKRWRLRLAQTLNPELLARLENYFINGSCGSLAGRDFRTAGKLGGSRFRAAAKHERDGGFGWRIQ